MLFRGLGGYIFIAETGAEPTHNAQITIALKTSERSDCT